MDALAIKRGVIQAFHPANWTATVQVLPSQGNYLTDVQVAKHLLAAEIVPGDQCAVLFFDELNPADAIIIAVYSVPPAGPLPPVTSLSGGAGSPLTGDVQIVAGSNVTVSESGQQITIAATNVGAGVNKPQVARPYSGTTNLNASSGVSTTVASITYTPNNANATIRQIVTIIFAALNGQRIYLDTALDGTFYSGANSGSILTSSSDKTVFTFVTDWVNVTKASHTFIFSIFPASNTAKVLDCQMSLTDFS
jgi:hypothetical protein